MILTVLVISSLIAFLLFTFLARMIMKSAIKEYKTDVHNKEFIEDNLIITEEIKGSKNYVYEMTEGTSEVIDRYVISKYNKDYKLIIKFKELKPSYIFKINLFNKHKAYIGSYLYKEITDKEYSSDIKLPPSCLYVRIEEVGDEQEKEFKNFDHRAKRIKKEQISLLQTYAFFSLLLPATYALIYLIDKDGIYEFFNLENAIFLLVLMAIFTIINFISISNRYTKKTAKVGGR